jgi:hypothetical protein
MADTGGPPPEAGLEARVARLESDVAHIRSDVADVRSTLNRLAPVIDEMRGFLSAKLPELVTKTELVGLRSDTKAEFADLRGETKAQFGDIRREMADLRGETKAQFGDIRREMAELRLDIVQRPTRRQAILDIFAIVGLIGSVLTIASHFAH